MKTINLPFVKRTALLVTVVVILACSWLGPLDKAAHERIDETIVRALASYAVARGINGVFALAQHFEIVGSPAGVGVKIAPAKLFHAINELVEQFAHLMLIATIALGVQKLLMSIGAHWSVSLLLAAVAVGWIYFHFRERVAPVLLTKLLVLLLMIRFAVPIVTIGSDAIFQEFLATDQAANQTFLEKTQQRLNSLTESFSDAKGVLSKAMAISTELLAAVKDIYQAVAGVADRIVRTMIAFAMQTLILPVLMLWILWAVVKETFNVPSSYLQVLDPRQLGHAPPDTKTAHSKPSAPEVHPQSSGGTAQPG